MLHTSNKKKQLSLSLTVGGTILTDKQWKGEREREKERKLLGMKKIVHRKGRSLKTHSIYATTKKKKKMGAKTKS